MTAPAPQPVRPAYGPMSLPRILIVIGGVLFILAAFAAGGHALLDVPAWSWGFGGFAAFVWAWAWSVP